MKFLGTVLFTLVAFVFLACSLIFGTAAASGAGEKNTTPSANEYFLTEPQLKAVEFFVSKAIKSVEEINGGLEEVEEKELEKIITVDLVLNIQKHQSWPGPEVVNTGNGQYSRAAMCVTALLNDLEESGLYLNDTEQGMLFELLMDDLKETRESIIQ